MGHLRWLLAVSLIGCVGAESDEVGTLEQGILVESARLDGLCAGVAVPPTQCSAPVDDYGGPGWTQMHCCPSGYAMAGAHFNANEFLCAKITSQEMNCKQDNYYNEWGMKACPPGKYVKGYHKDLNRMICCDLPISGGYKFLANSQYHAENMLWNGYSCTSGSMLACQGEFETLNAVVRGIHVGNNLFTCIR